MTRDILNKPKLNPSPGAHAWYPASRDAYYIVKPGLLTGHTVSEEDPVNKSYKRLLLCIADEFFFPYRGGRRGYFAFIHTQICLWITHTAVALLPVMKSCSHFHVLLKNIRGSGVVMDFDDEQQQASIFKSTEKCSLHTDTCISRKTKAVTVMSGTLETDY